VKKSYERVLLAASQKWPVLLCGPSGSGKSALIAKLAEDSGNQGKLLIFLVMLLVSLSCLLMAIT
jgi:polynucleotide 5'-kinase involved in rRNA processing